MRGGGNLKKAKLPAEALDPIACWAAALDPLACLVAALGPHSLFNLT